jgi:hypothetical protein
VNSAPQDCEGFLARETGLPFECGEFCQRHVIIGGVAGNVGGRSCGIGDKPVSE